VDIPTGGDETLVPMTSDDPEVQDEVRQIIKKVIESEVAQRNRQK
jgi:hypothetical protein